MEFGSAYGRGMNRTGLSRLVGILGLVALAAMASPILPSPSRAADAPAKPKASHPVKPATTVRPSQLRPGVVKLEKRIAMLRDQLGITAAQRKPWREFAAVLRANESAMYVVVARRASRIRTGSAPENMRLYGLVAAVHAANVQRLLGAFQPLYDVLSERQRKIADTVLRDAREAQVSDGY